MNTSNPRPSPFTAEAYDAALKAAEAIGPPPPRIEFIPAPALGPNMVVMLVTGDPALALSAEEFEAFKARLAKERP